MNFINDSLKYVDDDVIKGKEIKNNFDELRRSILEEIIPVLIDGLIKVFNQLEDGRTELSKAIVSDLRFLSAVILDKKNEQGEYRISTKDYYNYIYRKIDTKDEYSCRECGEIISSDSRYCIFCGSCQRKGMGYE